MTYDVVTLGEAMLRYWVPAGERIESAPRFRVGVAGAEANVSVALARMGRSAAWLSRLPDNPLGRRVARALTAQGVDTSHVTWSSSDRMGTYYVELGTPPRPATVLYDRAGSAISRMTRDDVGWSIVARARLAYVSGITPALSESCRDVTFELMKRARAAGAPILFDVNYRSRLWDIAEAGEVLGELCRLADAVIVTIEDARDVFGISGTVDAVTTEVARMAEADQVVVTQGAEGATYRDGSDVGHVSGHAADVIDPIGAGDAFAAGVIIGTLEGSLAAGVELGAAMGAIEVGLYGDLFTVDPADVEALRRGSPRDVER